MTAQEFCYWLQGHLEISGTTFLTDDQVEVIKDHLQLVFQKVTPQRGLKHVVPDGSYEGDYATGEVRPVLLDDSRPMPGCSGRIPGPTSIYPPGFAENGWPMTIPVSWMEPCRSC